MTTSVYIHIPFCEHLCTYCDFAKRYYDEDLVRKYLDGLQNEIKRKYRGEKIKTIYIGGGTPSCLSLYNLKRFANIIKMFCLANDYEFTFEINPENINQEKLNILSTMGVNRISMGVESTNDRLLKFLGRQHTFSDVQEKIKMIKEKGITNINVDLIYAIPGETIDDLKKDLDNLVKLDITHISTYSLEIHDNTMLKITKTKSIPEELDSEMYYYICNYLEKSEFNHYEVSNFCKRGKESRHNLVYWHNEEYYGFGLGASGYVDNIRYDNTRSMSNYLKGATILHVEELSLNDQISYELILGFRLINGINKEQFKKKYQKDLNMLYNINELIKLGYLQDDGLYIKIKEDMIYVENQILSNFVD